MLLIHGDIDARVPVEQSEEMEDVLRKSGGSVQLHLVSGAGHDDLNRVVIPSWSFTQQFLEANLGKPDCVQTAHATSPSPQPTPRALEAQ